MQSGIAHQQHNLSQLCEDSNDTCISIEWRWIVCHQEFQCLLWHEPGTFQAHHSTCAAFEHIWNGFGCDVVFREGLWLLSRASVFQGFLYSYYSSFWASDQTVCCWWISLRNHWKLDDLITAKRSWKNPRVDYQHRKCAGNKDHASCLQTWVKIKLVNCCGALSWCLDPKFWISTNKS